MSPNRVLITIVAPHFQFPIRNGADLYISNKWSALPTDNYMVLMIASDGVFEAVQSGEWRAIITWPSTLGSKLTAVVKTLTGKHAYMQNKFNTAAFFQKLKQHYRRESNLTICSFFSSVPLVQRITPTAKLAVESHNFDPKYYLDRAAESYGLRRYAALRSSLASQSQITSISREIPCIALGEHDRAQFLALGLQRVVQSRLGYESIPQRTSFATSTVARIIFVGSLSSQMNVSAVTNFIDTCLQKLKSEGLASLEFIVAGSGPSKEFEHYLQNRKVPLFRDLEDDELSALIQSSHASIMPFVSQNGLKLKAAVAASRGVSTLSFLAPPAELCGAQGFIHSTDMKVWQRHLLSLLQTPDLQMTIAKELQAIATQHSWRNIVEREIKELT